MAQRETRHWHITVTVAGAAMEPALVRAALLRLSEERPFMSSMRYAGDRAEVAFWDEGESMLDVASLALRLWSEHRVSANLPAWEVVGLEVLDAFLYDGGRPGASVSPTLIPI